MLKNKRGLSGIVMTIILIALVLIAAAIVWAVVANMLETKGEAIDVQSKCLGIIIEPTVLGTATTGYANVTLERSSASTSEEIGGVGITLLNADETTTEDTSFTGNVAASTIIDVPTTGLTTIPTKVQVRIYFENDAGEKVFCSQITEYTPA